MTISWPSLIPAATWLHLAEKYDFRDIFLNNPNIGGRYSALSYFGLLPAALIGVDIAAPARPGAHRRLQRGKAPPPAANNVAAVLGVMMGELALKGVDKLTLITSRRLASFGDWAEQLIAESTGKEGKGILPIVGEAARRAECLRPGSLLCLFKAAGEDDTYDGAIAALEEAGQPVVRLSLSDLYELGRQFFLWELATAVAGACLGIQPFDQPNVETRKSGARQ